MRNKSFGGIVAAWALCLAASPATAEQRKPEPTPPPSSELTRADRMGPTPTCDRRIRWRHHATSHQYEDSWSEIEVSLGYRYVFCKNSGWFSRNPPVARTTRIAVCIEALNENAIPNHIDGLSGTLHWTDDTHARRWSGAKFTNNPFNGSRVACSAIRTPTAPVSWWKDHPRTRVRFEVVNAGPTPNHIKWTRWRYLNHREDR
jgi:hypothetical protein